MQDTKSGTKGYQDDKQHAGYENFKGPWGSTAAISNINWC